LAPESALELVLVLALESALGLELVLGLTLGLEPELKGQTYQP
jgi:hypothetical protein